MPAGSAPTRSVITNEVAPMIPVLAVTLGSITVAIAIVLIWRSAIEQRSFEERFPPLSDAEFVARCQPGTNPEVALKVRRIVAEHFAVEYARVHPSTTFIEDIGAD
jgi:hypothetical protein